MPPIFLIFNWNMVSFWKKTVQEFRRIPHLVSKLIFTALFYDPLSLKALLWYFYKFNSPRSYATWSILFVFPPQVSVAPFSIVFFVAIFLDSSMMPSLLIQPWGISVPYFNKSLMIPPFFLGNCMVSVDEFSFTRHEIPCLRHNICIQPEGVGTFW